MNERTLKKISNLGYDISWRYEPTTNSIVIQVRKDDHIIEHRIGFDINLRVGGSAGFVFYMNSYLIKILNELQEYEEGETND